MEDDRPVRPDPDPITATDHLLVQVRDELRTLNQHMAGGGAKRGAGELREPAKPKTTRAATPKAKRTAATTKAK